MELSEFPLFREYVIHGILNTDMMLHKHMMTGIHIKLEQDNFTPNESRLLADLRARSPVVSPVIWSSGPYC